MGNTNFVSKINKKISELRAEEVDLIERLDKERSSNISAWNTYGSELCTAEMDRNERKIQESIEKVREDIKLLRSTLVNKDDERALAKEVKRIEMVIRVLEARVEKLNGSVMLEKLALSRIGRIQKLLDII
jgi:cob(I)alamin adenosyltransferase